MCISLMEMGPVCDLLNVKGKPALDIRGKKCSLARTKCSVLGRTLITPASSSPVPLEHNFSLLRLVDSFISSFFPCLVFVIIMPVSMYSKAGCQSMPFQLFSSNELAILFMLQSSHAMLYLTRVHLWHQSLPLGHQYELGLMSQQQRLARSTARCEKVLIRARSSERHSHQATRNKIPPRRKCGQGK